MKRLYIAYGSNLNVEQMEYRCPGARVVGKAMLKDWELLFRGSKTGAYLTIGQKKGSEVPVAVWEVTEFDEDRLDIYEGYPTFYYKKDIKVMLDNYENDEMEEVDAFVYIMHENRPIGVPSDYYMQVCQEGYEEFDFNERYLWDAYFKSVKLAV